MSLFLPNPIFKIQMWRDNNNICKDTDKDIKEKR